MERARDPLREGMAAEHNARLLGAATGEGSIDNIRTSI
jgi:hypothetical protein